VIAVDHQFDSVGNPDSLSFTAPQETVVQKVLGVLAV
jgi:hypothetical protein